jgi:hypothetical protein
MNLRGFQDPHPIRASTVLEARAILQAVSRRLPTTAARVRA